MTSSILWINLSKWCHEGFILSFFIVCHWVLQLFYINITYVCAYICIVGPESEFMPLNCLQNFCLALHQTCPFCVYVCVHLQRYVCVHVCRCVCMSQEAQKDEGQSQGERPHEKTRFYRGFGCPCIITPTADKACLCLFSLPNRALTIHAYTHLLYVSTEAPARGEKEEIWEKRRRRGRRERRMENRFMKWSIQIALSACCEKHL